MATGTASKMLPSFFALVAVIAAASCSDGQLFEDHRHQPVVSAAGSALSLTSGPLVLPSGWVSGSDYPVAFFTPSIEGAGAQGPLPNFGQGLYLGRVNKGGQTPWFVYLAEIDGANHTATCRPMDGSSPRVSSWSQFNTNGNADAGIVINACLQGLFAAGGEGWTLELPADSLNGPVSEAVYYVNTQIVLNHAVTLKTKLGQAGPKTSCFYTVGESHGYAGTRNPSVTCVRLTATPCPNCGNPNAQFSNPIFPGPASATHLNSQEGFILAGNSNHAIETHGVILQNLIIDGGRGNRNPQGQCTYNRHNGGYNISFIHCRGCQLLSSASVANLCGVNVAADLVDGSVNWNTIASSGSLNSPPEQSDGLTFVSAKGSTVNANVLKDATDGNSFFSASGLTFVSNEITVTAGGWCRPQSWGRHALVVQRHL